MIESCNPRMRRKANTLEGYRVVLCYVVNTVGSDHAAASSTYFLAGATIPLGHVMLYALSE